MPSVSGWFQLLADEISFEDTVKLHYIEPRGTGSIFLRFEIGRVHLFALILAGPFTVVR